MKFINKIISLFFPQNKKKRVVTVFPKDTIVKYNGVPCRLLEDTKYYSESFPPDIEGEWVKKL